MKRTRSEGVSLRPFTKLEKIEEFFEQNIKLKITSNSGAIEVGPGDRALLPPKGFETVGLEISFTGKVNVLAALLEERFEDSDDLSWIAVARDTKSGILRESSVIAQGAVTEIGSSLTLKERGAVSNARPLSNAVTGFELEYLIVLNKDKAPNPVRPWQRGTIVASAVFLALPLAVMDGIQPVPLTSELRKTRGLSTEVWFDLDFADVLEGATFDQAVTYFVDEKLLSTMKMVPEKYAPLAQSSLVVNVISQLVFEASRLLNTDAFRDFEWDGMTGATLTFTHRTAASRLSPEDFIATVREAPSTLVRELSSKAKLLPKLIGSLESLMEETDELSDDLGD